MTKGPVRGMTTAEKNAEYQGMTYYFRAEACRRKSVANPAEFVK